MHSKFKQKKAYITVHTTTSQGAGKISRFLWLATYVGLSLCIHSQSSSNFTQQYGGCGWWRLPIH